MNSHSFVDTGPPPEKVTPLALDTRTGQSVGPDDRQSFIAHATSERKSIRAVVQLEFAFEPASLNRQQNTQFLDSSTRKTPRK
jgi:hypothetical protein